METSLAGLAKVAEAALRTKKAEVMSATQKSVKIAHQSRVKDAGIFGSSESSVVQKAGRNFFLCALCVLNLCVLCVKKQLSRKGRKEEKREDRKVFPRFFHI
jgi:hypothetical protein